MLMNDEGLLECPLCGGNDAYSDFCHRRKKHFVVCGVCSCNTGEQLSMSSAIRNWNTRNGHLYTADDYKQDAEERKHGL